MRIFLISAIVLLASSATMRADEPVNAEYFEKKVRPILAAHCVSCHGAKKEKGELRLDAKAGFTKGGESGPLVKPGDPEKSLLVQVVRYDGDIKMPPKGKLSESDIAILTTWVKGGAPWPDDMAAGAKASEKFDLQARAKAHWSFQQIQRPAVPEIRNAKSEIRNDIDRFLLAKLNANGLEFAPPADKRVLLRRVTFDLIGLPPTPAEIEAFLKDDSPDAYEKVVDRLLASPQYGERWARHWLDLVRYAETHGHEFDYEIANAWRYRDYVIRAFNADVPFDQFVTEHVAGDLLPKPRRNPKDGANESLVATAFWWLGEAKHSPVDSRAEYADRIDNQIDVFGKAFLGLTLACARCHDHKFDPISAKDYYSLFSVIASSRYSFADVNDPGVTAKLLDEIQLLRGQLGVPQPRPQPIPQSGWRNKATAFETFGANWRSRWDASGSAFHAGPNDDFPHSGREVRKLAGAVRSPLFTIDQPYLAVRVAGREAKARVILNGLQLIQEPIYGGLNRSVNHGEEWKWLVFDLRMWKGQAAYFELLDDGPGYVAIREAYFAESPPPADSPETVWLPEFPSSDKAEVKSLIARIRELEAKIPEVRRLPTMRDGTGIDERVFVRGSHKNLGVEAPRAFLEAFDNKPFGGTGSGRLELAKALTDPKNPLLARVIANRLWKHHFGEGLVRSPDDFGYQGERPTHPELLDWLASEFVNPRPANPSPNPLPQGERGLADKDPSPQPPPPGGEGEQNQSPPSLFGKGAGGLGRGTKDPSPQAWSLKRMHRLMVLSTAYRQSSRATEEQAAKAVTADPQNKLLHRQNVRRLEAEAIRDAILIVSGRLDPKMEGPGVLPHLSELQVGRGKPSSGPLDGNGRRSIYLAVRRNFLNSLFTAFDYPTPFTTIGRRTASNVPAQALVMLNNPFVLQQAELWAKQTLAGPNRTTEQRISGMYETAFGRLPTRQEQESAIEFLKDRMAQSGKSGDLTAWSDLAHVLFNTKSFIFLE